MQFRTILIVILLFVIGCSNVPEPTFLPAHFEIPESTSSGGVVIEPLTSEYAEMDYEAVMESKEALRLYFDGEWPPDSFTLEENMQDIKDHEKLAEARISFAYTVMTTDKSRVIGCIYVNPTDSVGYDAQVHSWLRSNEVDLGFQRIIADWINAEWPFDQVIYW